ncbi:MAG: RNA polymerase subunit sigma-70 [Chthoniobacterales bacterium]|nr:MAG: RNA polymerase subunit sigma-70 [Chthoniobacterales bacterium]
MRPPLTDDQFSALIDEHKGIIYKIAHSYCRNAEDRKDLIQEIIVHVWKSHGRYDPRFKQSTWIYRIALNVAISAYRREKRRSERTSPLEEIIIEPAAKQGPGETDPKIVTLHRLIDQLDELNRALMILYLDDNSYRDIAGILGLTETNVATKINRLKLKIKEQFNQTNPD